MITASSCQKDNITDRNPILSAGNENDLGIALKNALLQNPGVFPILSRADYPFTYAYLDDVMRMVEIKTQIRDTYDWEIIVYEDDSKYNAFTLPGGKIIITTGFLKFMNAEHQLFSLIAHESFYTDRINQNSAGELSLIMQKLKESDKYDTQGTIAFLDVINNGNNTEAMEMVLFAMEAKYETYEVLEADSIASQMICENYLYSAYGIKEMIIEVEDTPTLTEFDWFENKPPVPNTLYDPDTFIAGPFRDHRVGKIDEWADLNNCGTENTTQNISTYNNFISTLP